MKYEIYLELVAHDGIVVDYFAHSGDQADDLLRHVVAGSSLNNNDANMSTRNMLRVKYLSSVENRAGNHVDAWISLDSVIKSDDVQDVQKLSLVLVDALDLNTKP